MCKPMERFQCLGLPSVVMSTSLWSIYRVLTFWSLWVCTCGCLCAAQFKEQELLCVQQAYRGSVQHGPRDQQENQGASGRSRGIQELTCHRSICALCHCRLVVRMCHHVVMFSCFDGWQNELD